MAAALSSSSAADSLPPWVLLNRLARVWDDDKEDADRHRATAVKLFCSTTLSTLSVSRSLHPDPDNSGRHPYIVAYEDRGILLHLSTAPGTGFNLEPNPGGTFLVVPVRGFIPAMAGEFLMPAAATIRVPERVGMPGVYSIKSMGLLSRLGTRSIEYMVAELQGVDDAGVNSANLFRFRSGSDAWVEGEFLCPGFNPRCVDQVISHDGRLWWIDLGKVMLGCNPFENQLVWFYQDLPDGVARRYREGPEWAWPDMEKTRFVTVSTGMLRFLELKGAGTSLSMWTLVSDPEDSSTSWIREFMIDLSKIRYPERTLPLEMPVVAIVHPEKAEVIYLFADERLLRLDVAGNVLLEMISNISPTSLIGSWNGAFVLPPLTWRYLIAWDLSDSQENHLSALSAYEASMSADHRRRRSLGKLCRQGVKAAQILACELGAGASSLGSNLHYLNEEVSEAKSWFEHASAYKTSGQGYVARATSTSSDASRVISKFLGGASSALSYGGTTFTSAGFALQKLHPKAQTGASAIKSTDIMTIGSLEEAKALITEWRDTGVVVIAEVPPEMETGLAEKIIKLFRDSGALVLVENSPILREKATRVLDDTADWEIL